MRGFFVDWLADIEKLEERHDTLALGSDAVDRLIVGKFWRARGLFVGCHRLALEDLSDEAAVLSRSLFTESLHLTKLAASDLGTRRRLILGWVEKSAVYDQRLVKEGEALGLGSASQIASVKKTMAREAKARQQYRDTHGLGKDRSFGDEQTLVKEQDRSRNFWEFLHSHQLVHGSESAVKRKILGGTLQMRCSSETLVESVAGFAAKSMLLSDRAACQIFGWPEPAELQELLSHVK